MYGIKIILEIKFISIHNEIVLQKEIDWNNQRVDIKKM